MNFTQAWQWICLSGSDPLIRAAIREGVITKDTKDADGVTPLHLLALCGYGELLNYVVTGYDFNIAACDNSGSHVVHYAGLGGHEGLLNVLRKNSDVPRIPYAIGEYEVCLINQCEGKGEYEESVLHEIVVSWFSREKNTLAYVQARGMTLQQTAHLQKSNGWTEAMSIFSHGSLESQLAYIQARGKTLLQSACLRSNRTSFTEAMFVFSYTSAKTQLAYIQARGKTLQQTVLLKNNDDVMEGSIALSFASRDVFTSYLSNLKKSTQRVILNNCYATNSNTLQRSLDILSIKNQGRQTLISVIGNVGLCIGVDDPDDVLIDFLDSDEIMDVDFSSAVILGMTINGEAVTRKTPGFSKAITNIDEFKTAIASLEPKKAWKKFGYLIEHCEALREVRDNPKNGRAVNIANAMLVVLKPLEAYSAKALHSDIFPQNDNSNDVNQGRVLESKAPVLKKGRFDTGETDRGTDNKMGSMTN